MNMCKKCGRAFYGAIGENFCGDCRKVAGQAPLSGQADGQGNGAGAQNPKKDGFWRRFFGSKKQG